VFTKKLLFLIALCISVVFSFENAEEYLEITYHSISNNDTVQINSGLALSFSEAIDLESLNAESITYMRYYYEGQYHTDSSRIFIQNSENITMNCAPLSFWYDSEMYSCAFLNETTVDEPDGTGLGFPLYSNNTFVIQNVTGADGSKMMNSDFVLMFYSDNQGGYNVVPNPYVYPAVWQSGSEPLIFFMHLPTICSIYIFSIDGDTVNYIEHNSELMDGIESWALENMEGRTITSGIYLWKVESIEFGRFNNGVLFTVLPETELSIISDKSSPFEFSLNSNYPNPFNSITTIEFSIPSYGDVHIEVFDLQGRKVETIFNGKLAPGIYSTTWNVTNLSSGVYFIRIIKDAFIRTRKAVLLR